MYADDWLSQRESFLNKFLLKIIKPKSDESPKLYTKKKQPKPNPKPGTLEQKDHLLYVHISFPENPLCWVDGISIPLRRDRLCQ